MRRILLGFPVLFLIISVLSSTGSVWFMNTPDLLLETQDVIDATVMLPWGEQTNENDIPLSDSNTRAPDSWPMFHHFTNNSRYSTSSTPDENTLAWKAQGIGDKIISSPSVINGKVFIGSLNDNVYCLDEKRGNIIWRFQTGGDVYSSAAIENGRVYIASRDRRIYCLPEDDPNGDGLIAANEVHWSYTTGGVVESSPIVSGGKVYCGSMDDYLYCLDATTGGLVWRRNMGEDIVSSPAVVGDRVYMGAGYYYTTGSSIFRCLNATTGDYVWNVTVSGKAVASPVVVDGKVYLGAAYPGDVYCLPAEDPDSNGNISADEIIWTYATNSDIEATPAVANGKVFVGCANAFGGTNKVVCLNSANGNLIWNYNALHWIYSSPAVGDGKVFFECENGLLYCIPEEDPNNNGQIAGSEVIWTLNCKVGPGAYTASSPSIANGRIFIGGGSVYCIGDVGDITSPQVTFVTPVNDDINVPLDTNITATFSENMNETYLTAATFVVLDDDTNAIEGEISYDSDSRTVTFDPSEELEFEGVYQATLTTGIPDLAGNGLDGDGDGAFEGSPTDDYSWSFTAIPDPYEPPYLATIPTQYPIEEIDWVLNLTSYITDLDTPLDNLNVTENSTYGYIDGIEIIFNYPEGVTYEHVRVTVADHRQSSWQDVLLVVVPVNDPPVITGAPTEMAAVEEVEKTLDLEPYLSDIDNPLSDLWVIENSSYAEVEGFNITFFYPNGVARDMVNVTISDGDRRAFHNINVTVEGVNDSPEWGDYNDILVTHEIPGYTQKTFYVGESITFSVEPCLDVDGDELTYLWSYGDDTTETTGIDLVSANFSFDAPGAYNVTLTVSDPEPAVISQFVEITVAVDFDGDGMNDLWELDYGLDILSAFDANRDDDNDGYTNLEEFKAGTDMDPTTADAEKHPDYVPLPDENETVDDDEDDDEDDDLDDTPDNDSSGKDSGAGLGSYLWIIITIIIFFLLVVLFVLFIVLRKKRKDGSQIQKEYGKEAELPPGEALDMDRMAPEETPPPDITVDSAEEGVVEEISAVDDATDASLPLCGKCGGSAGYYSEYDCYWCEPCQDYVYPHETT